MEIDAGMYEFKFELRFKDKKTGEEIPKNSVYTRFCHSLSCVGKLSIELEERVCLWSSDAYWILRGPLSISKSKLQ